MCLKGLGCVGPLCVSPAALGRVPSACSLLGSLLGARFTSKNPLFPELPVSRRTRSRVPASLALSDRERTGSGVRGVVVGPLRSARTPHFSLSP